ncbi:hypothetical protein Y1Q_0022665 [Alligator mississippiensis]|uniref:Uncharacterized protein n=1 Tax=Alligator mississippiensis TaxID=8496 RepID=A0A151PI84_ALLMI|nr:hypothetical protein Y1Q_0022665 [Alligator mississippiensis]
MIARFDQFASYIRSTLLRSRNLLIYRHMKLEVADCVKTVLSKLQSYYQKMIGEDGEGMANTTWQRDSWHRLYKDPPQRKMDSDSEGDDEATGSSDSNEDSKDDNSSSGTTSERDSDMN